MRRSAATGTRTPSCGRSWRVRRLRHYHDGLNTPAFFEMLPDVDRAVRPRCRQWGGTQYEVARGAWRPHDRDRHLRDLCSPRQRGRRRGYPLGIDYRLASAVDLPFDEASFDFVSAFMSLMDIPETERVLAEVFRVLKPEGLLPVLHYPSLLRYAAPQEPARRGVATRTLSRSATTSRDGRERSRNGSSPPLRRMSKREPHPSVSPFSCGPLSSWLNSLVEAGFLLERFGEPYPSDETVGRVLACKTHRSWLYFLHVRARKTATTKG